MIGGFAAGVLVAFVVGPEGVVGIVEQLAVALDGEGEGDGAVGEGADGAGDEEFRAGLEDAGAERGVGDGTEGDGEELVGPQVVIGGGIARALCPGRPCRQSLSQGWPGRV